MIFSRTKPTEGLRRRRDIPGPVDGHSHVDRLLSLAMSVTWSGGGPLFAFVTCTPSNLAASGVRRKEPPRTLGFLFWPNLPLINLVGVEFLWEGGTCSYSPACNQVQDEGGEVLGLVPLGLLRH